MKTKPRRWWGLALALGALLLLAWGSLGPAGRQGVYEWAGVAGGGPAVEPALALQPAVAVAANVVDVRGAGLSPDVPVRVLPKPSARDPFLLAVVVPVVAPPPVAMMPTPPPAAAPVMPSAPALQLRFVGRLQTADGRSLVMAQWSDGRPVTLEEGKLLGNGYRVERFGPGMVELLNTQTQAVVQLPLPAAPRFETR